MLCTAAVASLAFGVYAATPVFRHRFDSAKDDSGRYTGQAMSGAVLTKIGDEGIVDLGTAGGWFDFGTSLGDIIRNLKGDYAIVVNLMIPSTTSLGANGNFIFNFGQSSSAGYAFLGANQSRYSIGKSDVDLELTLTLSKGTASRSVKYPAHVLAQLNDTDAMEYDLDNIVLRTRRSGIRSDVKLPVASVEGSVITWKSANKDYITDAGKLLKLAEGEEGVTVTLTATATRNGRTSDREFEVVVAPRENYDSYLFTYFPSNEDENLYYAISRDGFNYTPLNGGKCVMASDTVAIKKGIRDPHILRGADGKTFYMVATDMKSAEGWASNRGIVMYKSTDLVNWTHSTVHFPDRFPEWKNVTRVWAPEVIWDPDYANADGSKGRYMIYYSLLTNDGKCTYDKVYYSYANDDFTGLLTDPVYFYDRGSATIDCDIVWDETTQLFHMFFKNEGSGGICKVTAKSLLPEPGQPDGSQWSKPSPTLQCTGEAVEGAGVFPLINSDKWILMYDCYMNGHYQFCETEDLDNFTLRAETTEVAETTGATASRRRPRPRNVGGVDAAPQVTKRGCAVCTASFLCG